MENGAYKALDEDLNLSVSGDSQSEEGSDFDFQYENGWAGVNEEDSDENEEWGGIQDEQVRIAQIYNFADAI